MESVIFLLLIVWVLNLLFTSKNKQAAKKAKAPAPPVTVVAGDNAEKYPAPVQPSLFGGGAGSMTPEDMTPERMTPAMAEPSRTGTYQGSMGADSTHEGEDPCHSGDTPYVTELRRRLEEQKKSHDTGRMDHRLTVMQGAQQDEEHPETAQPGFRLSFAPEDLKQAIIMSEILNRPTPRKRHAG